MLQRPFSIEYPYLINLRYRKALLYSFYGISSFFAIIGIWNPGGYIIENMEAYNGLGQNIWGIVGSDVYHIYVLYIFFMSVLFIVTMIYRYFQVDMKIIRMQIFISLSGFIIAFTLLSSSYFIPKLTGDGSSNSYPLTTVSFTVFALFVLYTIYRYRTFLVSPEEHRGKTSPSFDTVSREKGIEMLEEEIDRDVAAMAFVSVEPKEFLKALGKDIYVFQISREAGNLDRTGSTYFWTST